MVQFYACLILSLAHPRVLLLKYKDWIMHRIVDNMFENLIKHGNPVFYEMPGNLNKLVA